MMNQIKMKHRIKSILQTVSIPIIIWIIFHFIDTEYAGVSVITTIADVKALLRTVLTSFCFALAINSNLTLGRVDFSAGAQMFLGCIFGGNIALTLGLGGIGVLVLSMLIGMLSGLFVGVLFIKMRILPMVLGIGMTLVFETISFAAYKQQGLMLYGKENIDILSDVGFIIVVAVILLYVVTYLFSFSEFGYKRRAIQGNQQLASDSGINIYTNCVQNYALAGALVACAGVFDTAYKGTMTPVVGMSSNAAVFSNMFPMFLGMWIGRFSNNPVLGMLMGSLSVKLLTMGLSKLSMQSSMQNIIIYSLFLILQIYRMNAHKITYNKEKKERIKLAKQAFQKLAL